MRTKSRFLPAALLLGMITSANAATIDVTPWIAPNALRFADRGPRLKQMPIYALYHGLNSYGAAGPDAIQRAVERNVGGSHRDRFQFLAGTVAGPGALYQNEYRQSHAFRPASSMAQGSQFSISQLSFVTTSTRSAQWSGVRAGRKARTNTAPATRASSRARTILLFTGDDIFVTSGLNTQLVDGLVGRGSGNSYDAYCPGCTVAQQQAALDASPLSPAPATPLPASIRWVTTPATTHSTSRPFPSRRPGR